MMDDMKDVDACAFSNAKTIKKKKKEKRKRKKENEHKESRCLSIDIL